MNWGLGIALTYTVFALWTASFVAFAMGRRVDLVSPDYYAQSLRQDEKMRAVRNARKLRPALSIVQSGDRSVGILAPLAHAGRARGTITLYRPSDAKADRVLDLALDANGRQQLSLEGLAHGHWIVQCRWTADGHAYYMEQSVTAR